MDNKLSFTSKEKPTKAEISELRQNLRAYNRTFVENKLDLNLMSSVRSEEGTLLGGIYGRIYWEWLYIDLLWVDELVRGAGVGTKLLHKIEEMAQEKGIHRFYLSTTSFQARGFYEKMGYQQCGKIEDLPPGHTVYYFKKTELRTPIQDT